MAGGMTPQRGDQDGGHGTLAERIARTREAEAARAAAPAPAHGTQGFHGERPAEWADALRDKPVPEPVDPGPAKHCWYDGPHGRQAALLLDWSGGGKVERRGKIAVARLEPDGHWAIVEMWVEQGLLSPAEQS